MKKLFSIVAFLLIPIFLLIPVFVSAAPFLICDPQGGVTTYKLTGPPWVPVTVPAQADGSIKMDVTAATVGANALTVAACIVDPIWGEACSVYVPFEFSRPSSPVIPGGIRLLP